MLSLPRDSSCQETLIGKLKMSIGTRSQLNQQSRPANARCGRWPVVLLILAVIAGGTAYFISKELSSRTNTVLEISEADLQASFNQMFRADHERDPELLRDVLSGRDPEWADAAQLNAELGNLYRRDDWGWAMQGEPRIISQTLNSAITEYEVTFELDFSVIDSAGKPHLITVEHMALFRKGDNEKWLLAPPANAMWGRRLSSSGNLMDTIYPEVDQDFGRPFAQSVESLVSRTCNQLPELRCSSEIKITVNLSNDLAALRSQATPAGRLAGRLAWDLPAPTLFGRPTTAVGTELLAETYLRVLARGLISEQLAYQCCQQHQQYEWLLDQQLAGIGLGQSGERLSFAPSFSAYAAGWAGDASVEKPEELGILFDFMATRNGLSLTDIQRTLGHRYDSFWDWVWTIEDSRQTPAALERQFGRYVAETLGSSPTGNRQETLLLSCVDNRAATVGLFKFNPHTNQLSADFNLGDLGTKKAATLNLVGQRNGIVYLNSVTSEDTATKIENWVLQNNTISSLPLAGAANRLLVTLGGAEQEVAFGLEFTETRLTFEAPPRGQLVALTQCQDDGCPSTELSGIPIWSPDGNHLLVLQMSLNRIYRNTFLFGLAQPLQYQQYEIWLTDADMRDSSGLGSGSLPFWLDNETVAFVDESSTLVAISAMAPDEKEPIFSVEQLAQISTDFPSLVDTERLDLFTIETAIGSSVDPDLIYLVVTQGDGAGADESTRRYHFIGYNRANGSATYLFTENAGHFGMSLGPAGDYLTVYTSNLANSFGRNFYYNIDTGELFSENRRDEQYISYTQAFGHQAGVSWSPSGDWLLSFVEGSRLWSPRTGEELDMPYESGNFFCYDAIWLETTNLAAD